MAYDEDKNAGAAAGATTILINVSAHPTHLGTTKQQTTGQ